jgi:16S rRNA (guanine1207-N2)-methyltransferase
MSTFPYDLLRRWPDLEAPELLAVDGADRLLLTELDAARAGLKDADAELVVIGDNFGAVTLGALRADEPTGITRVRVHQDARSGELALDNNATALAGALAFVAHQADQPHASAHFLHCKLDQSLVEGAHFVVMRLPRSLEQLDQWAALIAAYAADDVWVLAGGRVKHMTHSMNEVLGRYFDIVQASLAEQKSRVLRASVPRREQALEALAKYPLTKFHPQQDLTVCAHGGVFAGINIDIGTRAMLEVLDQIPVSSGQRVIDFGCGTGVLAAMLARLHPNATIIASDQSAAAVASAEATLEANNLADRVAVVRDDGLSLQRSSSADVIVFNPPFHSGAAVHADTSVRLFNEAARVLKPGGELWIVANRHLGYKASLRTLVGETTEVHHTPKFTVTRSIKGAVATTT